MPWTSRGGGEIEVDSSSAGSLGFSTSEEESRWLFLVCGRMLSRLWGCLLDLFMVIGWVDLLSVIFAEAQKLWY